MYDSDTVKNILARWGHRCAYCGVRLTANHKAIKPGKRFMVRCHHEASEDRLVPLCRWCNSYVHSATDKTTMAKLEWAKKEAAL